MSDLPLTALLSQALVAFTIEADNEFEHRMPHYTTTGPAKGNRRAGPWLVSMAMWCNCLRYLDDDGTTLGELERQAGLRTNLRGMRRWGYVTIEPDRVIRPTALGRQARAVWQRLPAEIEGRWDERLGVDATGRVRDALRALLDGDERTARMPTFLPILGYGLWTRRGVGRDRAPDPHGAEADLPTLLARALLGLAVVYERDATLSLAISANAGRVLEDGEAVRVRDLPSRTGVSKEANAVALGFLERQGLAVVEPDPDGSRFKRARLTATGRETQQGYAKRLAELELGARRRVGDETISGLRAALEAIVIGPTKDEPSPLSRGLDPYPDGWRASVPKPETLPHFPMVLHRGGYPDGS